MIELDFDRSARAGSQKRIAASGRGDQPIEERVPKKIYNSLSTPIQMESKDKYPEIEKRVIARLEVADPDEFELLPKRKVGARTYDAILARKAGDGPDVLVEVKYVTKKAGKDFFYRMHDRTVSTTLAYTRVTGRRPEE